MRRWSGRIARSALLVVAAVAGWATPASAHAQLLSTEPAAQAVLPRSPGKVVLHFGEAVEVQLGSIRVYDAGAHRVDSGEATHPAGDSHSVATTVPANLPPGGYVVTWRVISADSHPVHGAFVFQIGTAALGDNTRAEASRLLAATGGSRTVGVVFGIDRFVAFLALAVLVGGAAFVEGIWQLGGTRPAVRRLLWAGWGLAAASTVVGIGLQGAYGGALPLGDVLRPSVVRAVLHTRYGEVALLRLAVLAVAAVLLWLLFRPRPTPRPWRPLALLAGGVLLLTPGLAGHAGTGSLVALTLPFDLIHLAGVSVWTGGLVVLALAVLTPPPEDAADVEPPDADLPDAVRRFSQWAFVAVIAIAVSGGVAAWRQVGSFANVTTTPYGRLVLYKTIAFVVVVAVASASRRIVHGDLALPLARRGRTRHPRAGGAPGPRVRRAVLGELGVIAVVFGLTAVLVNAPPARQSVSKSSSSEVTAGDTLLVDTTVQPTTAGPITVHLYLLTPDGATADPPQVTATFALPNRGIDGVDVPLQKAGPGHYVASGVDIPIRGRWVLQVTVRTSDTDEVVAKPISVTIH